MRAGLGLIRDLKTDFGLDRVGPFREQLCNSSSFFQYRSMSKQKMPDWTAM